MKRLIGCAAVLCLCGMGLVCGADATLPDAAKKAFDAKYPGATEVKVAAEDANFEVKFKDATGTKREAEYAADGTLISESVSIKVADLPKAVSDLINTTYPGCKIEKAAQETEKGVTTYEVKIETKDDKDFELEVAADGSKILEAKEEKEEKNEKGGKEEKK